MCALLSACRSGPWLGPSESASQHGAAQAPHGAFDYAGPLGYGPVSVHTPAMCESAISPANPLELLRNPGMAPLSWPSVHAYFYVLTGQGVQQSYMPGHLGTVLANARGLLSSLRGSVSQGIHLVGVPGSGAYPGRYTPTLEPSEPFGTLPDREGSPRDHPCRLAPMADRQGFPKERSVNFLRVPSCRAIFQMSARRNNNPTPASSLKPSYGTEHGRA